MPDGSAPRSATHYEIAWALDQMNRTPGFPALQVYCNRSAPGAPLESDEEPEALCWERRSVQEFLTDCEHNDAFVEGCSEYRDLGEFEAFFRKHFRDYIVAWLRDELPLGAPPDKALFWNKNPFRGLSFFDYEDASFFYGRTKSVGELLDVLQQQAAAKKPFVLVLGPSGSGKTSLVRAGVLPILTRVGTTEGEGPWRFALARPAVGGGDPFGALAAAFLKEGALPEFPDAATHDGWRHFAAELRERPENAAFRICKTLNHLSLKALNPFLNEEGFESPLVGGAGGDVGMSRQYRLLLPKVQLALVVDQLEELFVGGFSAEVQQKYLATLGALVRCQRVFVIAILRDDFYAAFRKSCTPKELAILSGRFELNSPSPQEIGDMIRLPTEGIGLRFEREPETGQSLDVALLEAATVNAEPLPLLEHVLWELWRKQRTRKDGLLRWSDYRESGELENSLADHAERVLLALGADAQGALKPVIRQLVSIGHGEEARLIRRTVPKCDLVATSEFNHRQKAGAKALIDRFIDERLFHGETDPEGETLVSVAQESLLRNWPRVCHLLDEDLGFLRMRDRLEAKLKLWLSKGRRSRDLLRSAASLSEAETLVQGFRDSLNDMQVEYLQRSLKARSQRPRLRPSAVLGGIGGLAVLVAVALGQRDALQTRLKGIEAEVQQAQKNTQLATSQRDGLQAQLKETEAKAQQATALAASQRDSLQAQLKETEAKVQQAQQNAQLTASQRDALQTQLKETEAGSRQLQKDLEVATSQHEGLQGQLKETEAKAQQDAALVASQRDSLQAQLNESQAKAQQAQKDAELAASQRDALQAQLKETAAKVQQAEQNAGLAASQRDTLQTRLKETEASAQQTQKNAQQVASQRDALQAQLKEAEAGSQQLQKDLEVATSQREGLQGQLKDSEVKLQQAQNNDELAANERDRLQAQLAGLSAGAQRAQKSKGLGSGEAPAVPGDNVDPRSSDPTPKNKPTTQDQEPAEFARMNQSQATASPPIPSVAASVAPTPEAQADSSSKASGEERSLKQFVQEYIQTVASDDISAQEHFFAHRVNFYGEGVLSLLGVQASMERYHREWPIRKWEPSGEPEFSKTLHSTNPHLYEVLQPLTWTVSNGLQHKQGKATLYVRIWKNDKGEFHIVQVQQRNP
jgi:hypothetical protein